MTYWQNRQQQLNKQMEKDEAKLKKRLSSFYDAEFARLEKEIAAYYQKYGKDNVIEYRRLMENLPDADKKLLIEQMDEFEKKYPQYADLIPVRESIYKLNRLEGLQYSIRMQQLEIGAVNNEQITAYLNKQAERGVNAAAEAMGFGKNFYANNPDITKLFVNVGWNNGKDFSQRIWENVDKLSNYLRTDIAQAFARGDSYDRIVRQLRERFSKITRNDAYRLIYTEGTYVMAESTIQPFTEDFEKYKISTVGDGKVCPICKAISKETFNISERQAGVNFPPFHPWCVLPDTKVIAPNIEAMTKSWYSGDVIKITTSNGRRLTITPNHIVLTSRGWVRAKNLIKGDKVVNYCGWRESIVKPNPAHNDGVPTIEKLFASLVESGAVSPVSVPATPKDLKGDVVTNSKIDIININSELRDKLNISLNKFVSDISFVGAPVPSKVSLSAYRSLELLLTGAGLAADGIVSGSDVVQVLLNGSFTHHKLISFRLPTDYDARIFKSSSDSRARNVKDIGEFVDAFPGIVEFDDLISVEHDSFFGHVYDASSLSTLYIANGIITSNCRCTFEIVVDDWDTWMDQYVADKVLTDDEEYSLKQYVSGKAYIINDKLRNNTPLNDEDEEYIHHLDNALRKMPKYQGNLNRSLLFDYDEDKEQFIKTHQKGNVITYDEYLSATKDAIPYDANGQVQIYVIQSSRGRDISTYNKNELEVLYPRKSSFEILDVITNDKGITNIFMREVISDAGKEAIF